MRESGAGGGNHDYSTKKVISIQTKFGQEEESVKPHSGL